MPGRLQTPPTRRCVEAPPSGRAARFGDVVEALLGDVHRYLALLTADAAPAEDLAAGTFEKAFWSWRRFDAAARIRADMAGRERPALRSDLGRAAS